VVSKTARKFVGIEMKSPRSKKIKIKSTRKQIEHKLYTINNKKMNTKVRDTQVCLQIKTRDSEVQVDQLRGAGEGRYRLVCNKTFLSLSLSLSLSP
jgi:hypothetical protein